MILEQANKHLPTNHSLHKCTVCGKEKVLIREDIHTVYKMLGLDDFEKKLNEKISQRGLGEKNE